VGDPGQRETFFPIGRRNSILKRQFQDVSPGQMERMTEMFDILLSTPNVKQ